MTTKTAPRRGAIYGRISDDGSGLAAGVERQRQDCADHCKAQRITVVEELIDNDISASKYSRKKRPAYARLLDLIDEGAVNTVVTWHIDRLYRQPVELEGLIKRIDQGRDLTIVTLNGEIDLRTDDGQAMARIMVAMAAKSSADTSRRVKRKRADEREKGEPPLSNAFGWRDRWTHDPVEARIVVELADRVLAGESLTSLAHDLERRGVPMKRKGTNWHPVTVRQILKAPRHAGLLMHDGELIRGKWDPIIKPEKWYRVQAVIARRGDRHRFARHSSLLAGLVRCGNCGGVLARHGVAATSYLRCKPRKDQEGCGLQIRADVVESFAVGWVLGLTDRENLGRELAKLNGNDEVSTMTQDLTAVEAALGELQAMVALHVRTRGREGHSPTFAAPISRQLETDAGRLRAEIATATTDHGAIGSYVQKRGALRKAWEADELDLDKKRSVLRELLALRGEQFVVAPKVKGIAIEDRVEVHATA